jgi:hypothetical protein
MEFLELLELQNDVVVRCSNDECVLKDKCRRYKKYLSDKENNEKNYTANFAPIGDKCDKQIKTYEQD